MSTHNIGFYEDLTKNIFELASNIIKYAHISSPGTINLGKCAWSNENFIWRNTFNVTWYEAVTQINRCP